jgi:hypothetical protein
VTLLLTFLSALALLVLLAALNLALYRVQAALESINVHVSKILWGVRAIERETTPLAEGLPQLRGTLTEVLAGAGVIATGLASVDQHLGAAADLLAGPAELS